jgi:hypothetical protein
MTHTHTHRHTYTHTRTHALIRVGTGQLVLIVLLHRWCSAAVGWDWEKDHVNEALSYLANARRHGVTTPSYVRIEDVRDLQCYQSQLLLSYWTGMTVNPFRQPCVSPPRFTSPPRIRTLFCTYRHATILSIPNCDTRRDVQVRACDGSDVQYAMGRNACKFDDGNCCEHSEERLA